MKNEVIFVWLALGLGFMETVEPILRIISLAMGSLVGFLTAIKLLREMYFWFKKPKPKSEELEKAKMTQK